MSHLTNKTCVPCTTNQPPLKGKELEDLHLQLGEEWKVIDEHHLMKEFSFKNFKEALAFVNEIGHIAEEQGHHPEMLLSWGKIKIMLYTHKINGLSENDFVLAAKVDASYTSRSG